VVLSNLINQIELSGSSIDEEKIEDYVPLILDMYSTRINSLSNSVYGTSSVAQLAFRELASQTIHKGLRSFFIEQEHWKSGRKLEPYILKCLSRLSDSIRSDLSYSKKISIPVCPGCKALGQKEFTFYEGKSLRCTACTNESERLEKISRDSREEYEYRIRKLFSLHSRKGYKCPSCDRFLPKSFMVNKTNIISCLYDNCSWFGLESELELMNHPLAQTSGMMLSLDVKISNQSESTFANFLDGNSINPDVYLENEQKYEREFSIANEVIDLQKERTEKIPFEKNFKKILMYQAFKNLLVSDPYGMLNYLINGKSLAERPIHSLIFQEYISLIENKLPFNIIGGDGLTEVYSLLDPDLALFLGVSEFQSFVKESGYITNNTHEIYTGAKCKGPCFIGYLCDIKNEEGKSLLDDVDYYTFSNVKLKTTAPNTKVVVTHFRIPPHYEMFSLVNLQRIRRKVVDSIYKRLNGEARPLKGQK
jgi:hypothetical protein